MAVARRTIDSRPFERESHEPDEQGAGHTGLGDGHVKRWRYELKRCQGSRRTPGPFGHQDVEADSTPTVNERSYFARLRFLSTDFLSMRNSLFLIDSFARCH